MSSVRIEEIISLVCNDGSGLVELEFTRSRILGTGLSGLVGKFYCEESVSAYRDVVGIVILNEPWDQSV